MKRTLREVCDELAISRRSFRLFSCNMSLVTNYSFQYAMGLLQADGPKPQIASIKIMNSLSDGVAAT